MAHKLDGQKYLTTLDKLFDLAKEMKVIVDDNARFPDLSKRDDIKAKQGRFDPTVTSI